MSRAKRIKIIVDLADDELATAAATLREVRHQRDQLQYQLNELNAYLQEYMAKMTTSGQGFLPIQLQTTLAFSEKLKQAVYNQQEKLDSYNEYVEKAQEQWVDKRVRFNALHKVYEKLVKDEQIALSKAEQKWLDELAAQNFRR